MLVASVLLLLRAVVRSLRLRASTPTGFALTPDRQPRLWLDGDRLRARRPHAAGLSATLDGVQVTSEWYRLLVRVR